MKARERWTGPDAYLDVQEAARLRDEIKKMKLMDLDFAKDMMRDA